MSNLYASELDDRRLLKVSGSEAHAFLQGILTCDIEKVVAAGAGFGGLLSPQGKILFDFLVIPSGEEFLLDVSGDIIDDLVRRLTFYRLRADVKLEICEDGTRIFALWGDGNPDYPDDIVIRDPRMADLGWRIYSSKPPKELNPGTKADYHSHRITIGVAQGGLDYSFGSAFPHEALYDQTGGVDFAKGCYVGQEVVSRMHHRSTARKRIIQVCCKSDLPPRGTRITSMGRPVGEMGSVSGNNGLAMLRLDHVANSIRAEEPIVAGDVSLRAQIPTWTNLAWPGE